MLKARRSVRAGGVLILPSLNSANALCIKIHALIYWREHYAAEPYYDASFGFEDYLPAWRTGWEGRAKYAGRSFEDAERDLQADFHWNRGESRLLWEQARAAVRAAFERTV